MKPWDEWVLVKSADELTAGMWVLFTVTLSGFKNLRVLLLRQDAKPTPCRGYQQGPCCRRRWR